MYIFHASNDASQLLLAKMLDMPSMKQCSSIRICIICVAREVGGRYIREFCERNEQIPKANDARSPKSMDENMSICVLVC